MTIPEFLFIRMKSIFRFDQQIHHGIKKGSAPAVKSVPGQSKVLCSGFVFPQTGQIFASKPERFHYETLITSVRSFPETCLPPEGKICALVMDNAHWHKKTMRLIAGEYLDEYSDIFDMIECIKLPPYSPDLNPIEQVWHIAPRENTHNFFETLSKLKATVDKAFEVWALPNHKLRTLCSFN